MVTASEIAIQANFPHWDRNTNTGQPAATADRVVTALQTVIHDALHPSHILLPIIPGRSADEWRRWISAFRMPVS